MTSWKLYSFLTFFSIVIGIIHCKVSDGWPMDASGTVATNWTGTWYGVMEAYPDGEVGNGWNVTLEIGLYPKSDNSCTVWRSIYTEDGVVRATKDYRFCRGCGADDLYIDEGDGVTIGARWIHDVLVSPFKYKGVYAMAINRMRGDVLEEEIFITDDPLVSSEDVVISARPRSIHSMTMKKKN